MSASNQPEPDADEAMSADLVEKQLAAIEARDLRVALAALSRLATSQVSLTQMLKHLADFAVQAIPGADGAGVTLLQGMKPETVVATPEFVDRVEAIQYGIGQGPCVTAAAERRVVRSGSLGRDPLWPRFGPRAARINVNSALAVPLVAGDELVGALNIYAHDQHAFDDQAVALIELFAGPAAIAVQNANAIREARDTAEGMRAAMITRAVIDQAVGVLVSRTGCSTGEALGKLRAISQAENRRLSLVAQQLLDEAARRARARGSRT
jgi:GAF domain-containing protein